MKLTLLMPATMAFGLAALSDEPQSFQPRSAETNGLYVIIDTPQGARHTLLSSEKFGYGIATITNGVQKIRIPQVEYLCMVELSDSAGRPVPATKMGRKIGSRFEHLIKDISERKRVSVRQKIAHLGGSEDEELPSPDELFKIDKTGRYTLKLTFQIIVIVGLPARADYSVVRFPPISYPVEKK